MIHYPPLLKHWAPLALGPWRYSREVGWVGGSQYQLDCRHCLSMRVLPQKPQLRTPQMCEVRPQNFVLRYGWGCRKMVISCFSHFRKKTATANRFLIHKNIRNDILSMQVMYNMTDFCCCRQCSVYSHSLFSSRPPLPSLR